MGLLLLLRRRVGGQALFDFICWFVAVFAAGVLRFDFDYTRVITTPFFALSLFTGVLGFVMGKLTQIYRGRFPTGSLDELVWLSFSALAVAVPVGLVTVFGGNLWGVPRSTIFIATPLFLLAAASSRVFRRLRAKRGQQKKNGEKVLIYGAGQLAERVIPQLLEDPTSSFIPVGLLDDDPRKANRWVSGVKMFGSIENLATAAKKSGAQKLIVAIPQAKSELLFRTRSLAEPLGIDVLVVPSFNEILASADEGIPFRQLGIEDLVGRKAVKIDSPQIRNLIRGKSVLITGAGGSIGVELSRQVSRHLPNKLILLDRDESGLHQANLVCADLRWGPNPTLVLVDIRDRDKLTSLFHHYQPDIVFHAAALKHLPILENFPSEAWKTNVIGTLNVLRASQSSGVSRFVNISTDKAADPTSVLGESKLLAERLTAWASQKQKGSFVSVRFGNVLGSRGSLIPTLQYLIASNRPLTVTHPHASRYFMTIAEACQLVLQAGTYGESKAVYILDMGKPVKINDVAKQLISLSGKNLDIIYTGLKPGEKLEETLLASGDESHETDHPSIRRTLAKPLDPSDLEGYQPQFGC
jgi:FlaA1/EpsC-like NDP-sugar epimerase